MTWQEGLLSRRVGVCGLIENLLIIGQLPFLPPNGILLARLSEEFPEHFGQDRMSAKKAVDTPDSCSAWALTVELSKWYPET